jgi:hypothetical protein
MNRALISVAACGVAASAIAGGCGGGGGGGLSDPGLSNVQVEVANARSAVIGPEGGTITATGANGFVYTLTIPAGSVLQPTTIGMYPIKALTNLPQGGTVSGGVNFAPDGLALLIPATLTIQLPANVDAKTQFPIAYTGNADKLQPSLGTVSGQTIKEHLHHFSGTALAGRQVANLVSFVLPLAQDSASFEHRMADAFRNSQASNISPRPDYLLILRNWYDQIVKPALVRGSGSSFNSDDVFKAVQEYTAWLDAVLYAQLTLPDASFNVQPENSESEPLAVKVIKNWYKQYNDVCAINKDQPLEAGFNGAFPISPILDAEFAMLAGELADQFHISRAPNGLDKETLLNNLCVKVKIDSKSFSGNAPGDVGALKVTAGFTIDNGPTRHDAPVRIKISGNGASNPSVGNSVDGNPFNSAVTWPQGANTLTINILATLFFVTNGSNDTPDIAVFDRITKTHTDNGGGGGGGGSGIFGQYDGTLTDQSPDPGPGGRARIFLTKVGNLVGVEIQEGNVGSATGPGFNATLTGTTLHADTGDQTFDATISGNHMTATLRDKQSGGDVFRYDVDRAGS